MSRISCFWLDGCLLREWGVRLESTWLISWALSLFHKHTHAHMHALSPLSNSCPVSRRYDLCFLPRPELQNESPLYFATRSLCEPVCWALVRDAHGARWSQVWLCEETQVTHHRSQRSCSPNILIVFASDAFLNGKLLSRAASSRWLFGVCVCVCFFFLQT